ncbi:low temperature requirement protein A [Micromonospora fluostatini]|uniref:low temperature requirement protein A n=1 Tax=Micromonospora sp. JCM 30529 TaxID=3421643 RepID=UPI003D166F1D
MELFVDLFFVFAFLKVATLMSADLSVLGTIRGVLVILLLWHCWTSCAWLGNVLHADRGGMPLLMTGVATAVLVIGVAVPETFADVPGNLSGPVVVVGGYLLIRFCVLAVLTYHQRGGAAGRRRTVLVWLAFLAAGAMLLVAALLPPSLPERVDGNLVRVVLFAGALGVDFVIFAGVGRGTWQIVSPWHLAERHAVIILVALGETIISIGASRGVGVDKPVTWDVAAAATLGMIIVSGLWWTYFDLAKMLAEHGLWRTRGAARTRLARDAYLGLHLPMIAGLIIFALGLKHAVAVAVGEADRLWDDTSVLTLFGGVLLYLLALVAFEWRTARLIGRSPLTGIGLLLALFPLAAGAPAVGALALLAVGVAAMAVADRTIFRRRHEALHHLVEPEAARLGGVSPRELFVDLVFVFAFIQVTLLMTRHPSLLGIVRGLTLLALLWWAWISYSWLANIVRTETALVRFSTIGTATAILVLGFAIPQAFGPDRGGLHGSSLIVVCYVAGQAIQGVLLWQVSRTNAVLRSVARRVVLPSGAALVILASIMALEVATPVVVSGSLGVTLLWVAALLVQYVGAYWWGGDTWRVQSVRHWVDRYALIMLIAFGEAIISVGLAASGRPVSVTVLALVVVGALAIGTLWWAYFTTIDAARLALKARTGRARTLLARDAFTYLHLPMVAGVMLVAFSLRQILVPGRTVNVYGHYALYLGVALYLAANQWYWWRMWHVLSWHRVLGAFVVAALAPLTLLLPPVWPLVLLTGLGVVFAALEVLHGGDPRTREPRPAA